MSSDFIVTWITWLNSQYPIVGVLMLMMLADSLTGICAAVIAHKLSSTISYQGMIRKVVMLLLVAVGYVLEPYAGGLPASKLVALCFIVTELISILENTSKSGVPIPKALIAVLVKLKTSEYISEGKSATVSITQANNVDIRTDQPTTSTGNSGISIHKDS